MALGTLNCLVHVSETTAHSFTECGNLSTTADKEPRVPCAILADWVHNNFNKKVTELWQMCLTCCVVAVSPYRKSTMGGSSTPYHTHSPLSPQQACILGHVTHRLSGLQPTACLYCHLSARGDRGLDFIYPALSDGLGNLARVTSKLFCLVSKK
jgi:hypothetical protein